MSNNDSGLSIGRERFRHEYMGLTRREYFAIKCMLPLIARAQEYTIDDDIVAKTALRYADAMLKELDK